MQIERFFKEKIKIYDVECQNHDSTFLMLERKRKVFGFKVSCCVMWAADRVIFDNKRVKESNLMIFCLQCMKFMGFWVSVVELYETFKKRSLSKVWHMSEIWISLDPLRSVVWQQWRDTACGARKWKEIWILHHRPHTENVFGSADNDFFKCRFKAAICWWRQFNCKATWTPN